MKGLESVLLHKQIKEIAIFGSASEAFAKRNINMSIDESMKQFEKVATKAISKGLKVRGYVSCVLGCPYEGSVSPSAVLALTRKMLDFGCYEVSLGDTIGVGTPGSMATLLDTILNKVPAEKLAVHCHDSK